MNKFLPSNDARFGTESQKSFSCAISEGETFDTLFNGKLKFIQDRRGYRFSLDAVLIAAFVNVRERNRVADLGTGSAVIPVILADRYPAIPIVGFDIQRLFWSGPDAPLRSTVSAKESKSLKPTFGRSPRSQPPKALMWLFATHRTAALRAAGSARTARNKSPVTNPPEVSKIFFPPPLICSG
jgi:hypothetical protein